MYAKPIDRNNRGAILILIDQSLSMTEPAAGDALGRNKAQAAADFVNRTIMELVLNKCMKGEPEPRDYFDIGVLGYRGTDEVVPAFGGPLAGQSLAPIPTVASSPARLETKQLHIEATPTEEPVWVEPYANGPTPMAHAFYRSGEILSEWVTRWPHSFPPVIINISDGMANDTVQGQTAEYWAAQVKGLQTSEGNVLLFNVALAAEGQGPTNPVLFPTDGSGIPDQYGQFLFNISSPLPSLMLETAGAATSGIQMGSRGFVFNAGVHELALLLNVGTAIKTK